MSTKENVINCVNNSKSKNDFNLNYFGYCNKKTYDKLNNWIVLYELDISHWKGKEYICFECGNKTTNKKFCCRSCSVTHNNKKRVLTDETKNKIRISLHNRNYVKNLKEKRRNCIICNKTFNIKRIKNNTFSKSKCCSNECRKTHKSNVSKISMERIMKEGKHKGWIKRNIISYPEKFFIQVLKNNNIKYEHNYSITKKDLGVNEPYSYFLDFYIKDKNIDLEIDGKQHEYRKEHDKIRDKILKDSGYNIYRIKWKSINSKNGKKYIKEEINKFLGFYNSI